MGGEAIGGVTSSGTSPTGRACQRALRRPLTPIVVMPKGWCHLRLLHGGAHAMQLQLRIPATGARARGALCTVTYPLAQEEPWWRW